MPVICPNCKHPMSGDPEVCAACGKPLPSERVTLVIEQEAASIPEKEKAWRTADAGSSRTVRAHINRDMRDILLPPGQTVTLGRVDAAKGSDPDVDLTPFDAQAKGVSRLHARMRFRNALVQVMDLDSTNGTYLNEKRISPKEWRIVRNGDVIRLGDLVVKLLFGENP